MPNILIADMDKERQKLIKEHFEMKKIDVNIVPSIGDTAVLFEEYLPDLVILDYSENLDDAYNEAIKITEFDHTACIFATTNSTEKKIIETIYASGARAVIKQPDTLTDEEDVKAFFNQMVNICTELNLKKCIRCWESGRFVDTIKTIHT